MFRSFMVSSLLGVSLVAMLATETEAVGYRFCYGCGSDACQLETPLGGLLTSTAILNGLVSVQCNTRSYGAGVRAGDVLCIDEEDNVETGLSIQGDSNGTFGVEEGV